MGPSVTPIEFIFFVSIMLVPLGPYIYVETNYKRSAVAITVVGIVGTTGVGIAAFWNLAPRIFSEFKIPAVVAFPIIALLLAAIVGFTIVRARNTSFFVAVRNVSLLCAAMWVVFHLLSPMLESSLHPTPSGSISGSVEVIPSAPRVSAALEDWNQSSGEHSGPIGPELAAVFMYKFDQLPKPCAVKITAPDNGKSELATTLGWLLTNGRNGGGGAPDICVVESPDLPPIDADDPTSLKKNGDKGIIIHWNPDYQQGDGIARWFDANGFIVSTSHRLPKGSPENLIWIDIGPGSPWK